MAFALLSTIPQSNVLHFTGVKMTYSLAVVIQNDDLSFMRAIQ